MKFTPTLTKRIIPCLDVKDFRTVKGVNFENLQDAGDAISLAQHYSRCGADELVFLDISATQQGRKTMVQFAERVAQEISIPFTIGGGISSIQDMEALFRVGADKISINSAAVHNPDLISQASKTFGNQAVVVAIDAKQVAGVQSQANEAKSMNLEGTHPCEPEGKSRKWNVFTHGGQKDSGIDVLSWITQIQDLGAGEILLTSMDCDGVKKGFDLPLLRAVNPYCSIPLIASGGAGKSADFLELFGNDLADAGLAASIFHFGEVDIMQLKEYLQNKGVCMRI